MATSQTSGIGRSVMRETLRLALHTSHLALHLLEVSDHRAIHLAVRVVVPANEARQLVVRALCSWKI